MLVEALGMLLLLSLLVVAVRLMINLIGYLAKEGPLRTGALIYNAFVAPLLALVLLILGWELWEAFHFLSLVEERVQGLEEVINEVRQRTERGSNAGFTFTPTITGLNVLIIPLEGGISNGVGSVPLGNEVVVSSPEVYNYQRTLEYMYGELEEASWLRGGYLIGTQLRAAMNEGWEPVTQERHTPGNNRAERRWKGKERWVKQGEYPRLRNPATWHWRGAYRAGYEAFLLAHPQLPAWVLQALPVEVGTVLFSLTHQQAECAITEAGNKVKSHMEANPEASFSITLNREWRIVAAKHQQGQCPRCQRPAR